jgi:LasA protease
MYLHIYSKNRVPAGNWMEMDQIIGYPSCEGGVSTGTHVHVARKYNGEWILADGPLPFVLSGWQAVAGDHPYSGFLVNGGNIIPASQVGSFESRIVRGQ